MPSKLQMYTELSETVVTRLTGSYQEWTAFLCTAGRLYKYPFPDQMMIYAQRPNATACAEYDFWNEKMRRYVMRGSSGIALIDTSGDKARLRYVFDVADTAELEKARRPGSGSTVRNTSGVCRRHWRPVSAFPASRDSPHRLKRFRPCLRRRIGTITRRTFSVSLTAACWRNTIRMISRSSSKTPPL